MAANLISASVVPHLALSVLHVGSCLSYFVLQLNQEGCGASEARLGPVLQGGGLQEKWEEIIKHK